MSGGVAGSLSKALVYPLDTARKRLQVQGPYRSAFSQVPKYDGVFCTMVDIIRKESVFALYKGIVPGIVKAGPASAVTFVVYGTMQRLLSR